MTSDRESPRESNLCSDRSAVRKEMGVHGQRWANIFDGYFSDPEVARPMLDAVERAIEASHPSVVADLGGGTGFLLAQLLCRSLAKGVRLVNVEVSEKQLAACSDGRIALLRASLDSVTRSQLEAEEAGLLLMARSVLHYFGRYGLDPTMRHLRSQLRPGEFFVHQSACYSRQRDADLMNHLYSRMGTGKWFFTDDELKGRVENAGFAVLDISPAPMLDMGSMELVERYGLNSSQMAGLGREIEQLYSPEPEIFASFEGGFRARLRLCIYTCQAV